MTAQSGEITLRNCFVAAPCLHCVKLIPDSTVISLRMHSHLMASSEDTELLILDDIARLMLTSGNKREWTK